MSSRGLAALFVCLLLLPAGLSIAAGEVEWTQPVLLSEGVPGRSVFPVIAGDKAGSLHVIWTNNIDREGVGESMLYYTFWNGTGWTKPVDVLSVPGPYPLNSQPSIAVAPDGRIHVVWVSWGGIYHSSAYVIGANSAQAWSSPKMIDAGALQQPFVTVTSDGRLHVVFLCTDEEAGVYYTTSVDGEEWSTPLLISAKGRPRRVIPAVSETVHMIADGQDRLYVVWSDVWSDPNEDYSAGVYFSRSTDGGVSWSSPYRIDEDWPQLGWPDKPDYLASLGIDGAGGIHVLWSATYRDGPSCGRQHRWSSDGGQTWTTRERVLVPAFHCLGWMNMVTDAGGTLHVVTIAGQEDDSTVIFHSYRTGDGWTPVTALPGVLTPPTEGEWGRQGIDRPRVALSEGNILNVVWHTNDGKVWFARGVISQAPHEAPSPWPSPTRAATAEPHPTDALPTPSTTATKPSPTYAAEPLPVEVKGTASLSIPFWPALLLVLAFLLAVVAVQSIRRR